MKIAVLIPTRGDRAELLKNCLTMIGRQTIHASHHVHTEVVDDTPLSSAVDITWRYRTGYDRLRGKGFDVIFMIEDDDYYAPEYMEVMLVAWEQHGRPELFGTDYTIYYHLRARARFTMQHPERASAMNTMIKPDLDIKWPLDHDPYTDLHLWMSRDKLNGVTYTPTRIISIGIKHGIGLTGGQNHTTRMDRWTDEYSTADPQLIWLREHVDAATFDFYYRLAEK